MLRNSHSKSLTTATRKSSHVDVGAPTATMEESPESYKAARQSAAKLNKARALAEYPAKLLNNARALTEYLAKTILPKQQRELPKRGALIGKLVLPATIKLVGVVPEQHVSSRRQSMTQTAMPAVSLPSQLDSHMTKVADSDTKAEKKLSGDSVKFPSLFQAKNFMPANCSEDIFIDQCKAIMTDIIYSTSRAKEIKILDTLRNITRRLIPAREKLILMIQEAKKYVMSVGGENPVFLRGSSHSKITPPTMTDRFCTCIAGINPDEISLDTLRQLSNMLPTKNELRNRR